MIVILLLLDYWYQQSNKVSKSFPKETAAQGQLVSGFPQELLLGATDAKVSQSYAIDYGRGGKQYTAEFTLKLDLGVADLKYQRYLKGNKYYIANNFIDDKKPIANLYATNAQSDLNIVIAGQSDNKTLDIIISYLAKGK